MKRFGLILLVAVLAVSCKYKDLCYHHPHAARVEIDVDWSESSYAYFDDGELPTGMTIVAYNREGGRPISVTTNNIHHVTMALPVGVYDVMLFNQSFIEFGTMDFQNTESFEEIYASSVESRVTWFMRSNPYDSTSRNPEWLALARIEGLEVTNEMIFENPAYSKVRDNTTSWVDEDGVLRLRPHTANKKAELTIKVTDEFPSLVSIRAVVNGFAVGYYMGRDEYSAETTGYQMVGWAVEQDPDNYKKATITTNFQIFGLSSEFESRPEEIKVYLECLLVDGETVMSFEFNVGDRLEMEVDDEGRVITEKIEVEIALPYVAPPQSTSGGFAIDVEDWDDELLMDIPIL